MFDVNHDNDNNNNNVLKMLVVMVPAFKLGVSCILYVAWISTGVVLCFKFVFSCVCSGELGHLSHSYRRGLGQLLALWLLLLQCALLVYVLLLCYYILQSSLCSCIRSDDGLCTVSSLNIKK